MREKINRFPKIGQRIMRTVTAVFFVLLIYSVFNIQRDPFYAAIATVLCTQPHLGSSKMEAVNRIVGTFMGAFFGALYLLLEIHVIGPYYNEFIGMIMTALFVMLVLYTTVLLKKTQTAVLASMVFLSLAIIQFGDTTPAAYIFYRVLDTLVGIGVAFLIMEIHLPRERRKDILFVSALDDTLVSVNNQMTAYSRVDLNKMLAEGAKFTIYTDRTPAAMISVVQDINLNLPVIAMGGAVLYDIRENRYMLEYIIPSNVANCLEETLTKRGYDYFQNVILDDVLLIYYRESKKPVQQRFYEYYRKSPYRNYIKKARPKDQDVVYFTVLDTMERLEQLKAVLESDELPHRVRVQIKENEFEDLGMMRIFNKNATRDNMIHYLKSTTGSAHTVTFGSLEGQYDVVVRAGDMNRVVKTMKKRFEPVIFTKNARRK